MFSLQSRIREADRQRHKWDSTGNTKMTRKRNGQKNVCLGCTLIHVRNEPTSYLMLLPDNLTHACCLILGAEGQNYKELRHIHEPFVSALLPTTRSTAWSFDFKNMYIFLELYIYMINQIYILQVYNTHIYIYYLL